MVAAALCYSAGTLGDLTAYPGSGKKVLLRQRFFRTFFGLQRITGGPVLVTSGFCDSDGPVCPVWSIGVSDR